MECRTDGEDGSEDAAERVGFDHAASSIPGGIEAERIEVAAFFVEDADAFKKQGTLGVEGWVGEDFLDVQYEGLDLSGE